MDALNSSTDPIKNAKMQFQLNSIQIQQSTDIHSNKTVEQIESKKKTVDNASQSASISLPFFLYIAARKPLIPPTVYDKLFLNECRLTTIASILYGIRKQNTRIIHISGAQNWHWLCNEGTQIVWEMFMKKCKYYQFYSIDHCTYTRFSIYTNLNKGHSSTPPTRRQLPFLQA